MRQPRRIALFLMLINIEEFCNRYGIKPMKKIPDKIKYYWRKNYNRTFGSVLMDLGYLSGLHADLYFLNDDDLLLEQGVPPEEFLYWAQMYDSQGVQLSRVRYILIKEMNTSHIEKILKEFSDRIPLFQSMALNNVLEKRRGNKASP